MKKLKYFYWLFCLFLKSFKSYRKEFLYFSNGKKRPLDEGLLIRKRGHHLERILFHQAAYSNDFKEMIVNELEYLLYHNKDISENAYYKWASRILSEYRNKSFGGQCPNIISGKTDDIVTDIKTQKLLKLMRNRRSRRLFLDIPLSASEKKVIIEAALQAPSSCNRQTLHFLFIEDRSIKALIAKTVPGGKEFFESAPTLLVILSYGVDCRYPDDRHVPWIDSAAAVQNILLICETMGIGCCWGSYTSFGSVVKENMVRRVLKIPNEFVITACLALGKSSQKVCYIPRVGFDERIHTNVFKKNQAIGS